MRLIDADELIERLQEYADNDWNRSLGGIFIDCIDTCIDYVENAPTAYDVEKVVAELEEEDRKANQYRTDAIALHNEEFWRGRQTGLLKSIEIVRNGGKE